MRRLLALLLTVNLACSLAGAAPPSGKDILRRSLALTAGIRDYTADIKVTVNMPDVKVPQRLARVYFKQPDKVAIDSKGIVMIPKKALVPGSIGAQLTRETQVAIAGKKVVDGVTTYFLKVTQAARQRTEDRLLVWVRGDRYTVERMEVYAAGRRELMVDWQYQRIAGKYWLPSRLDAEVTTRSKHAQPGTITVVFSGVKVNSGLSDKQFEEKKR